jgi:hypothetical protein
MVIALSASAGMGQTSCPPEVASAKAMLTQTANSQDLQASRSLAGARSQELQAPRPTSGPLRPRLLPLRCSQKARWSRKARESLADSCGKRRRSRPRCPLMPL